MRRIPIIAVALSVAACECQGPIPDVDPPTFDCDVADPVVQPRDACLEGLSLASIVLRRGRGRPEEAREAVSVPVDGELCISVQSDEASAASLSVAGAEVLSPRDVRGRELQFVRRLPVSAGEVEVAARLASRPDASLRVSVRFAPSAPFPEEQRAAEDLAALDRAVCDELNRNIDAILDPDVTEAFIDTLVRTGAPPGRVVVQRNAHGLPSYLSPLPTEDWGGATDPEAVARMWLARYSELMGLGDRVALRAHRLTPMGTAATAVVLRQEIAGLPVFGGHVNAIVQDGQVRRVRANIAPDVGLSTARSIDDEAARGLALAARPGEPEVASITLGFWDASFDLDRTAVRLAWQVDMTDESTAYVDATTGQVLDVVEESSGLVSATITEQTGRTSTEPRYRVDEDVVTLDDACFAGAADINCQRIFAGIVFANRFYERVWNRDGWSDGKTPDSRYNVVYDGTTVRAARDASASLGYPGGGTVFIGTDTISRDTVAHGFGGHGFLRDPEVRADAASRATGGGFLEEHAGDTIAILTALSMTPTERPDRIFAMDTNGGPAVRNHSTLTCTGYAGALAGEECDGSRWTDPVQAEGCREYTHLDFLDNLDGDGNVHRNSCPYTRIPFLLAQNDGPIVHHGIESRGGLSRELLAKLFNLLFRIDNLSARPDDYWGYQEGYRDAAVELLGRCATSSGGTALLAGIPECDAMAGASDFVRFILHERLQEDLLSPFWSLGFWSAAARLDDVVTAVPPTAVVADAAGDDPAGIYAFHALSDGADPALRYVVYEDPRVPSPATPVVTVGTDRLAPPVSVQTQQQVAAYADGADVYVAYAEAGTNLVRLLRRDAAGNWTVDTPAVSVVSDGGLAIGVVAGRELVAFTSPDRRSIGFFYTDEGSVTGTVRPADSGERVALPRLVRIGEPDDDRWLLLYVTVSDSGDLRRRARIVARIFDPEGRAFGEPVDVPAMPPGTFQLEVARVEGRSCEPFGECAGAGGCCPGQECLLGTFCFPTACSSDADCGGAVPGPGEDTVRHSACVAGRCKLFDRRPVVAEIQTAGFPISFEAVSQRGRDGVDRLQILTVVSAPPAEGVDPDRDAPRLSLTTVPLDPGEELFDQFGTSRQVRLPPIVDRGVTAVRLVHPDPTVGPLIVALTQTRTGVELAYRRSD